MVRTECRGEAGVYLGFITHLREGGREEEEGGGGGGGDPYTHSYTRTFCCLPCVIQFSGQPVAPPPPRPSPHHTPIPKEGCEQSLGASNWTLEVIGGT